MLACFFMGALPLRRAGHRHLTLALAGGALNLMSLADGLPLADTALYLGMTFYLLASASALADSDAGRRPPPPARLTVKPVPAAPHGHPAPQRGEKEEIRRRGLRAPPV